jgi:cation:H+ antiporter
MNKNNIVFTICFLVAATLFTVSPSRLLFDSLAVAVGLMMLIMAGDKLVHNASLVGIKMGWSSVLIGILIVGLGTSAPEIITVAIAGAQDAGDLALGNIFGSNIANIGLILGIGLLMLKNPIITHDKWNEYLSLVIATIAMIIVVWFYGKVDVGVSLLLLVGLCYYLYSTIKDNSITEPLELVPEVDAKSTPWLPILIGVAFGLAGLLIGAKILVDGAVNIAVSVGIPQKVIGLTIIAVGTSLPELAAAYASAKKGNGDLIIGNVLGSNVFNLLAASSAGGIFSSLPTANVEIDVLIMGGFTIAILFLMYRVMHAKILGSLLLASYFGFLLFTI